MGNFNNKTDAIIDLQKRGYDHDFVLADENIFCLQDGELIPPDGFAIEETYRFDGKYRLKDNYVIYAISAMHQDLKGILMISYNMFSWGFSIHLWSKLGANLNN